jgi:5,5'-dehydrodivanillate O-demethylase
MVFPTMLAVGQLSDVCRNHAFQIRVPIDDTHTLHFWYNAYVPLGGQPVPQRLLDEVPVYEVPFMDANGEHLLDHVDAQDIMAWVTQGPIADRTSESLGASDRGVTLLRRMLKREIAKVANGEDPIGVEHDPAQNVAIQLRVEKSKAHYADGFESMARRTRIRYSPVVEELIAVFAPPVPASR